MFFVDLLTLVTGGVRAIETLWCMSELFEEEIQFVSQPLHLWGNGRRASGLSS